MHEKNEEKEITEVSEGGLPHANILERQLLREFKFILKAHMTINILSEEVLSDNWGKLTEVNYEFTMPDGKKEIHKREVYDRGDGATILLYNDDKKTIILTKQFRLPVWWNNHPTGMFTEACAGKVEEGEDPAVCIVRETEEETGYRIHPPKEIFSAFMSPGSVSERIHFYMAPYGDELKVSSGGGQQNEQEAIEVMEIPFTKALEMVKSGEILDAKTIMLIQYAALEKIL
jgi:nudix-type nucleoside diphosphatase (YffH/AdpP family)